MNLFWNCILHVDQNYWFSKLFSLVFVFVFLILAIASLMNSVNKYSSRTEIYVLDFTWLIFQRISWDNIPCDIHVKSISCLEHMKKNLIPRAKIFMWNARENCMKCSGKIYKCTIFSREIHTRNSCHILRGRKRSIWMYYKCGFSRMFW